MLKNILISDIKVGTRFRKHFGDVDSLAESLNEEGLLQPIAVSPSNELVCGLLRLKAAKKLGWKEITAVETKCCYGEFVENTLRKDFEIDELVAIAEDVFKKYTNKGQRTDLLMHDDTQVIPKGSKRNYAAKQVGFRSRNALNMAKKILNNKNARLIENYKKGNISLTAACKIAELDEKEQGNFDEVLKSENRIGRKVEKLVKEIKNKKQAEKISKIVSKLPPVSDRYELYNEDCLNALKTLKPGSVNVVISDPPYDKPNLACYSTFGKVCNHVLKDGGLVICSTNHAFIGDHIKRMEAEGFKQLWVVSVNFKGNNPTHSVAHKNLLCGWRPWLVFVKGTRIDRFEKTICDVMDVKREKNNKEFFEWQQPVPMMEDFVKRFSEKGDIILDPFMGTGSTGIAALNLDRKFIGYEMDTENNRFNVAKHRIKIEVKKK